MENEKSSFPLSLRVVVAVAIGALFGVAFGTGPIVFTLTTLDLGELGLLFIRLLKALAVPLVLFAILDGFVRHDMRARQGAKLLLICAMNVSVAFAIGLTLMNVFKPGVALRGHIQELASHLPPLEQKATPSLAPLDFLKDVIPESMLAPLMKNAVIGLVLLGVLGGMAWRKARKGPEHGEDVAVVGRFISGVYQVLLQMLTWVVQAVPFAVFCLVAQSVGKSGLSAFTAVGGFLGVIMAGFVIHALIWYPTIAWVLGRKTPREYLGKGADAILTGLTLNSSLATVPVTLRSLKKMNVSDESARLAACVGTNLNNDGITLYEAMAALFLAQACGFDLSAGQQVTVVVASLMAGMGVAGVPEAGLIVLPLVLSAAGIPEAVIALVLPVIMPVDWLIARCRSGVNVMSDMLVAILLDRRWGPPTTDSTPAGTSSEPAP